MNPKLVIFIFKLRYFLLGFGLSGLRHDDFIQNTIAIVVTIVALHMIFEGRHE